MPLELFYDDDKSIPEGFTSLYTEKEGKFTLTGVNGMKTQGDVDYVKDALRKEREDHSATREKLKPWGDLNASDTHKKLDRIKELEAAAGGNLDEDKINEIVEGRISQQTGPLNRQIETLTTERDEALAVGVTLQQTITSRDMGEQIQEAAIKAQVHSSAIPDIKLVAMTMMELNEEGNMITKADGVLTPGLDLDGFFKEMGKSRAHWWPESHGGGAGGAGPGGGFTGNNPWKPSSWNLTQQGAVIKEQGLEVAKSMAKAAGNVVGGRKPLATKT